MDLNWIIDMACYYRWSEMSFACQVMMSEWQCTCRWRPHSSPTSHFPRTSVGGSRPQHPPRTKRLTTVSRRPCVWLPSATTSSRVSSSSSSSCASNKNPTCHRPTCRRWSCCCCCTGKQPDDAGLGFSRGGRPASPIAKLPGRLSLIGSRNMGGREILNAK